MRPAHKRFGPDRFGASEVLPHKKNRTQNTPAVTPPSPVSGVVAEESPARAGDDRPLVSARCLRRRLPLPPKRPHAAPEPRLLARGASSLAHSVDAVLLVCCFAMHETRGDAVNFRQAAILESPPASTAFVGEEKGRNSLGPTLPSWAPCVLTPVRHFLLIYPPLSKKHRHGSLGRPPTPDSPRRLMYSPPVPQLCRRPGRMHSGSLLQLRTRGRAGRAARLRRPRGCRLAPQGPPLPACGPG